MPISRDLRALMKRDGVTDHELALAMLDAGLMTAYRPPLTYNAELCAWMVDNWDQLRARLWPGEGVTQRNTVRNTALPADTLVKVEKRNTVRNTVVPQRNTAPSMANVPSGTQGVTHSVTQSVTRGKDG